MKKTTSSGRLSESKNPPFSYFGEKLDKAVTFARMTNVTLARAAGIDPSQISRFRTGKKLPSKEEQTRDICRALLSKVKSDGKEYEFEFLTGINIGLCEDDEAVVSQFKEWLYDAWKTISVEDVEKLLRYFDAFKPDNASVPETSRVRSGPSGENAENENSFKGNEGLRRAVLRLFGDALNSRSKEFLIYTDQDLTWMTEEPSFRAKLAELLSKCIEKGIKIKIIHNFFRFNYELADAFNVWLPLYFTAKVEPFVATRLVQKRYAHSLFINRGISCIEGSFIRGAESDAVFRYFTDKKNLAVYEKKYDHLLSLSKRFAYVNHGDYSADVLSGVKNRIVIAPTLTFATMPEKLLKKILLRKNIPESLKSEIFSVWSIARRELERALKEDSVTECFPLGVMKTDVPFIRAEYTKEEYAEHLREILSLSGKKPAYRAVILDKPSQKKTRVTLSDESVTFMSSEPPEIIFKVLHPSFVHSFEKYVKNILRENEKDAEETNKLISDQIKSLF